MSEKLKLANATELSLIPMGISEDTYSKRRQFKFTSDLSYEDIKTVLSDSANLISIDYILESGEISTTYADCVGLKQLSVEFGVTVGEETKDVYTASISVDATEKKFETVGQNITFTELALVEVYEVLLEVMQ